MAPIFTLAERLRTFYMSLQAQTWWNAMSPCRRTGVSCDSKSIFCWPTLWVVFCQGYLCKNVECMFTKLSDDFFCKITK